MMRKTLLVGLLMVFGAACAGTSYGVATDGVFPPRPAGANYPNWEHMCVRFDDGNATRTLNDASEKGWELVALGNQGTDNLMCFKRTKGDG